MIGDLNHLFSPGREAGGWFERLIVANGCKLGRLLRVINHGVALWGCCCECFFNLFLIFFKRNGVLGLYKKGRECIQRFCNTAVGLFLPWVFHKLFTLIRLICKAFLCPFIKKNQKIRFSELALPPATLRQPIIEIRYFLLAFGPGFILQKWNFCDVTWSLPHQLLHRLLCFSEFKFIDGALHFYLYLVVA